MTQQELENELKIIGDDVRVRLSYDDLAAISPNLKEDALAAYHTNDFESLYDIVQKGYEQLEFEQLADFLGKDIAELEQLPRCVRIHLCGIYTFEVSEMSEEELKKELNEVIQKHLDGTLDKYIYEAYDDNEDIGIEDIEITEDDFI